MRTDLSDEAFWEWSGVPEGKRILYESLLEAWQECRRRAQNREVVAFQEGWEAAIQTYGSQ